MMHESCKKSLTFTTLKLTNTFCQKKLTNTCYTNQTERGSERARERERKEREKRVKRE
jgi:hypothetical protein